MQVNSHTALINNQNAYLVLFSGILFVLLPHFSHIPVWLTLASIALLSWRSAIVLFDLPVPGKAILLILTLLLLTGIIFSYQTIVGRNAGSALLLGLLCLKIFEITSFRDISVIINLALFSIVINFLFSQTIPVALTMIVALIFIFASLISFQHIRDKTSVTFSLSTFTIKEKLHFSLAGKLLLQAIPLSLVLFFLFPRVDNPLWGLPEDAFSAKTGLSDSMSPGRISKLSNDNSVAFRVNFESEIPRQSALYWRGPVLWNFDGYNWTAPEPERLVLPSLNYTAQGEVTKYSITMEPHNNYWIFALDIPSKMPEATRLSVDMQLVSFKRIQKIQRFDMESYTNYLLAKVNNLNQQRYLQLPGNPQLLQRSRELMRQLHQPGNPEQTIANVLNLFANGEFYYSRNPPLLFDDPVDEFLFTSKRGYCEHYASSFTTLMRLAGIPARVVTGYQGGEINPIDDFMTLRQSDAHAWSEVYIESKGWIRVDPTAAIPPANIENTADAQRLNSSQEKPTTIYETSWLTRSFKQARFAWDAINNRWNQWIIGYNAKKQKSLFSAIGIPEISWQGLSQLLFSILGILTAVLAYFIFKPANRSVSEVEKYYARFLKKLSKRGIEKHPAEAAGNFAIRAVESIPDQQAHISNITELYQRLRYRNESAVKKEFIEKVQNF